MCGYVRLYSLCCLNEQRVSFSIQSCQTVDFELNSKGTRIFEYRFLGETLPFSPQIL